MNKTEKRSGYTLADFKTDTNSENKSLIIRGYAIIFNQPTDIYDRRNGWYKEVIRREALDNADLSDVYLLWGHDYNQILGHTRANLRLEVDDVGLFYECELPNTRLSRDAFNLVETRNYLNREKGGSIVDGNSFGFYSEDEVINGVREVRHMVLDEISIVSRPAYEMACSTAIRQSDAENVEHQQADAKPAEPEVTESVATQAVTEPAVTDKAENAESEVEHQQNQDALEAEQKALEEKLKRLEEL